MSQLKVLVPVAFAALCAVQLTFAQTAEPAKTPAIHIVYFGAADCPPCVSWRAMELPKLRETAVFKQVKFTHVVKTINSQIPASFFLPSDVKPLKEKLDTASGGAIGSPFTAVFVNGEVFDFQFGTTAIRAEEFEKKLQAIVDGSPYPFVRCTKINKQRDCLEKG